MSYNHNSNESKIRRRKISSSNSSNVKLNKHVENIENTEYTQRFDKSYKEEINKRKKDEFKRSNRDRNNKENDFEEIEEKIYYRKRNKKRVKRKNLTKKAIKTLAVLLALLCVMSSVVVAFALKGAPVLTKDMIYSSYKTADVVDINEIPDNLKNAIIATEDRRFYEHNGAEIRSLARSLLNNIFKSSTQGGSTIDMQVSKNLLTSDERSMTRKIKDIYNALQMNKIMTKDEILSAYLNNIYFGKSSYGVAQAAKTYFGKDVRNLDLAQCAMLAGITNNPARYMQHDEAKRRQKTILYNMYDQGYISHSDYIKAVNDPTPFKSEIAK